MQPSKLLLDPYAKAIDGQVDGDAGMFGYRLAVQEEPNDTMDSLGRTMASVVTDTAFDWGDAAPRIWPTIHSVIYEAHVRGITQRHPGVPEEQRGTFPPAGSRRADYFKGLGVTAIELMRFTRSWRTRT